MWKFLKKSDGETNSKPQSILNSDEYEKLSKRCSEILAEQAILKTKLDTFESSLFNLRGIINRKLGGVKVEEEEKPQEKKNEIINKDEFLGIG